jgi:hypothetical protein
MNDVFIETLECRRRLARRVLKLFDLWGLTGSLTGSLAVQSEGQSK